MLVIFKIIDYLSIKKLGCNMALKHKIYGLVFNLFRIFKIKENSVSFIVDNNNSFSENFKYVYVELKNRNENFELNFINKNSFSIKNIYKLSKSNYIFLNDNFFPLAYMNISGKTKIIQLWHGSGAIKKFGYDVTSQNEIDLINLIKKSSEKIDYVTVTSENIKKFYAGAFQVDENKVLSFGIPRLDYFNKENLSKGNISKIKSQWPEIKDKKIILYAPTFREDPEYNDVFKYFDVKHFIDILGEDHVLFIRLHPKINLISKDVNSIYNLDNVYDLSHYENSEELLLVSDILITDYSSIMADYTILNRPILLFAYDLDNYLKNERGFYFDYKEEAPGNIVKTTEELIDAIKNENFNLNKLERFKDFEFDYLDGNATKRILDHILK